MNGSIRVIFKNSNASEGDLDLFCGPLSGQEDIREIPENSILAHLCHDAGIFLSVSEARRNGWNKPIPKGFSMFQIGNRRSRIIILNLDPEF